MTLRVLIVVNGVLWGLGLYGVFHMQHADAVERVVRVVFRSPPFMSPLLDDLANLSLASLWCIAVIGIVACVTCGPLLLCALVDTYFHEREAVRRASGRPSPPS